MSSVKRLQIMIEQELDDLLALEARKEHTSKAALIRRYVRERLRPNPLPPIEEDPLWKLVGTVDVDPVDDIDEFLYGPNAKP
jgi:Ribbon-helix-helix protein, copG family